VTSLPRTGAFGASLAQYVLDGLHDAILVVDANCMVQFINRHARELLSMLPGLKVEDGRLVERAGARGPRLTGCIREVIAGPCGRRFIAFTRTRRINACVERVEGTSSVKCAAVVLVDVDAPVCPSPEMLRDLYRLTPAEATLANLFYLGKTAAQIAAERRVSINTIRTQLKSILSKTDMPDQLCLMRLLARLPTLT